MRVLVLSSRYPEAGGRGDQSRAWLSVSYLAELHQVTVLTAGPPSSAGAARALSGLARVEWVKSSRAAGALSAIAATGAGQPAQCGWMTPMSVWAAARRLAASADVVLAITARSLRGGLRAPIVLDHIDALSYNMAQRSKGDESILVRMLAGIEARRFSAWERRLAGLVAAQIASSQDVARLLPAHPPAHVIPIGWTGEVFKEPAGHARDIDVIFTGDMAYPPNRAGAAWLRSEILPRVRSRRPCTGVWIVGRSAARIEGSDVEIASDVPDLHAFLRRARVAVAPIAGAGSPIKTLEAAANGAAVVAAPWALDCYGLPGAAATDSDGFADSILALLADEGARRAQVEAMQREVAELGPARLGAQLEEVLREAALAGDAELPNRTDVGSLNRQRPAS